MNISIDSVLNCEQFTQYICHLRVRSWELSKEHLRFDIVLCPLNQESTEQPIKVYFITEGIYNLGYYLNFWRYFFDLFNCLFSLQIMSWCLACTTVNIGRKKIQCHNFQKSCIYCKISTVQCKLRKSVKNVTIWAVW